MTNSTFNKTLSIDWLCAHSGMSREVTAASTPTYLRRGLRGCLRSEWWRVNVSSARDLLPCTHTSTPSTRLGRSQVTISSHRCMTRPGIEPSLPYLVPRTKVIVQFSRFVLRYGWKTIVLLIQ